MQPLRLIDAGYHGAMRDGSHEYVLVTGEAGAKRLALLHATYGMTTEQLLEELGVGPGMRVADLGCGTGSVSMWMAHQVGSGGKVVGVDISAAQLEVAQSTAKGEGLAQLAFHSAPVHATGLPRASFDLVYCRFLLCHISDPLSAVKEMRALAKPGGWVVVEDVDLASFACDPPSEGLHRMRDLMIQLGVSRGVDYCLGPRVHRLFRLAGLAQPSVRVQQPVHGAGEEKRFWEYTFLEAVPAMLQAGLLTAEQLSNLAQAMQAVAKDRGTMVMQARKIQVWARA